MNSHIKDLADQASEKYPSHNEFCEKFARLVAVDCMESIQCFGIEKGSEYIMRMYSKKSNNSFSKMKENVA